MKGAGLNETQLHDFAQFAIRNQIAIVPGARSRRLSAASTARSWSTSIRTSCCRASLSVMDVVNAVNDQNLILPGGRRQDGAVRLLRLLQQPRRQHGGAERRAPQDRGRFLGAVSDIGKAEDANATQYNIVRVDGQKSSYIPIMKQGGDTNTIQVVNGVRNLIGHLFDIPKQMKADCFSISRYSSRKRSRRCCTKA